MGRHRAIAGYFKQVVNKQLVTIQQNIHLQDENGNFLFEDDGAKPLMEMRPVEVYIDVHDREWVDQVNIPFTPEEEEARDAEEALFEYEKQKPRALTDREEMDLLIDKGVEAVKEKREEYKNALEAYLAGHAPLAEIFQQKQKIVEDAKVNELSAPVENQ